MAFLEISDLEKHYGTEPRGARLQPRRRARASSSPSSARPAAARPRRCAWSPASRPRARASIRIDGRDVVDLQAEPAQHRHGLPVLRALPQHDGGAERRLRAEGRRRAAGRHRRARRRDAAADRAARARRPLSRSSSPAASSSAWRWRARSRSRPKVLLLDEPLSALDAKIRVSLREEIRAIQRELGITTIYVTHDQEEALSMSDRIVVMNAGVAEQIGDPFEIYNRPATRFVASFVGTLNVLDARVADPATRRRDDRRPAARARPAARGGRRARRSRWRCARRRSRSAAPRAPTPRCAARSRT